MSPTKRFPGRAEKAHDAVASAMARIAAAPVPARDASSRSSRLYSYGIAAVFSLMLIVLVVVGVMLWSG